MLKINPKFLLRFFQLKLEFFLELPLRIRTRIQTGKVS